MKTIKGSLIHSEVCRDHKIFDVLPCPWPGCNNGCKDDQFQLITPVTGNTEVYKRREWNSYVGEVYYSWDGDRLPNWFTIEKIVWMEARRRGLIDSIEVDEIFHYTNLEGLMGIINTGSIWLSDYSYLNDSRELLHGSDIISDIANEMLLSGKYKQAESILQSWITGLRNIQHRICIASFSMNGDSLSQWNGYGNIAIGFNPQYVIGYANETQLMPIIYDLDSKKELIKLFLSHMCQSYEIDINSGRLKNIEDVYHKTEKLQKLISFLKDDRFADESEYRIVYLEDKKLFDDLGIPIAPKRFRVSKGKLIPYLESKDITSSGEKPKLDIKSVILGPNSHAILRSGIREFLDCKGYNSVAIRDSSIPYRT